MIIFNKEEYKELLLRFIINNNLPFSIIESNSFLKLLKYINEDLPTISRGTIKNNLDLLYNKELVKVKKRLSTNNSLFSITLDEWSSNNNIDFLAITLYYYNKDFKLESYLLGFEDLGENTSYTGIILYNFVDKVLKDFNINKKLLSITRDNASSINNLIETLQYKYKLNYNIDIIDTRCVAHVINLISNSFLAYIFFIPNNTKIFKDKINSLVNSIIEYKEIYNNFKDLPNIVRNIIVSIKYNYFLKNIFKQLVKKCKLKNYNNLRGAEKLLRDNPTRWLSTYNMLERFIYFKEEIDLLLDTARKLDSSKKKNLNFNKFTITTIEWNYLIYIRDILDIFRKPTIKLQAIKYSSNYLVIPYITKLLYKLNSFNNSSRTNIYIKTAIIEATSKLLEYYPITNTRTIDSKLENLFIITTLNPQFKLNIFKTLNYSNLIIDKIRTLVIKLFNSYKEKYSYNANISTSTTIIDNIDYSSNNSLYKDNSKLIDKEEIDSYLEEEVISKDISIIDYYNANKDRFPILYNIARDYLAILASSNPSKSTFSIASNLVTKRRGRLLPNTIKQLIILKSWNIIDKEELEINDNLKKFNFLDNSSIEEKYSLEEDSNIEERSSLEERYSINSTSSTEKDSSSN